MPEEAKLSFYKINRCGYYQHGTRNRAFGSISSMLSQLSSWATRPNFPLELTCTFTPGESEQDKLRVFCFDIESDSRTGDYFLTTWNETPSTQGKVPSVSGDQPVGSAQVHLNKIRRGTIPGYATYFWFLPDLQVFATIRFHHIFNGQQNLVKYLNGFLGMFSDHVVKYQIDDDNVEIEGYRESESAEEVLDLLPSFRAKLVRKGGEIALIREKRANIRKLIRKSILDSRVEEEKKLLQQMMQKIGINDFNHNSRELNVNYSLPYKPTDEELNAIIDNASEEGLSWTNDVGFQFVGGQEVVWLSNSIVKQEIELHIERENDEVVNLASLAAQLTGKRRLITRVLANNR
jgi:hypothetical protein